MLHKIIIFNTFDIPLRKVVCPERTFTCLQKCVQRNEVYCEGDDDEGGVRL